jgi:signal transduction histidine kinase
VDAFWDGKCIRRAVENLCSNAAKYGSPHSEISVDLRRATGRNAVTIRVHNFGNPIPPAELPNLFGLFHRSRTAEASGNKGWGLGLTIVKALTEAHGGTVSVTSSAEAGTEFILNLPAHATAVATA